MLPGFVRLRACRFLRLSLLLPALLIPCASAGAHQIGGCTIELRLQATGIDARIEAPVSSIRIDLPDVVQWRIYTRLEQERALQVPLFELMEQRIVLKADGRLLTAGLVGVETDIDGEGLVLRLRYPYDEPVERLEVDVHSCPHESGQQTFVNIYEAGRLVHEAVFPSRTPRTVVYEQGRSQGALSVAGQFLLEGIRHIFIGPDHILFIVGLLLGGGSVRWLLVIVTAFTVAHSVTLGLAVFNVVSPPPGLIEPLIAASIVVVGVHSLLGTDNLRHARVRATLAFCFGFVHGFGFAYVLRELEMPREALAWSLFSFNVGVEVGQACIVLLVAPLLFAVRMRAPAAGRAGVTTGAWGVILAGTYWFIERVAVNA